MELSAHFIQIGISLGLGLLVGLQRQRAASTLAGVRTFPLITVLGTICAWMVEPAGGWVLAAGFVGLAVLIMGANFIRAGNENVESGITTEVAVLLMFAIGAYLVLGSKEIAIATGVLTAVLLNEKQRLHGWVGKLGDTDVRAILQFAILALVILPALPNRTFGPFGVFNPYEAWLMVVLIVGINIGGYVAYKLFGHLAGAILAGVLGGLISSTATTASYARRTAKDASLASVAAVVISIASTVVFVRLIVMFLIVSPASAAFVVIPLGLMLGVMIVLSAAIWMLGRGEAQNAAKEGNPSELKVALLFGAVYALVIVAAAGAQHYFGERGLFAVAVISGLTDVDAITLSSANLLNDGQIDGVQAWRVVLIAALTNMAFKCAMAGVLGGWALFKRLALVMAIGLAAGIAIVVAGPSLLGQ